MTKYAPLFLLTLLLACGPAAESPQPSSAPATESGAPDAAAPAASAADPFKVALLTPGSISDAGWNGLAYQGLEAIKAEFSAEVRHVETKSPQEFANYFSRFGQEGYDLVFGHGFEYQDAAAEVAPNYPKTWFITTSGNTLRPNVAPIVFCMEQATYLLGVVSAKISKTGKLGLIGGQKIPSIESSFETFITGAKSVRPDIQVVDSYIGSWEDVVKGNEQAKALIQSGVDIIFHNADAAGRGMFQAVSETDNVLCFGSNANQNDLAPGHTLASAVIPTSAFTMIAKKVKDGTMKSEITLMDLSNGGMSIEWNAALRDRVPADVMQLFEDTKAKILSGEIKIPIKFLEEQG